MNEIARAFFILLLFAAPALRAQQPEQLERFRICTEIPPIDAFEAVQLDDLPPQFTARAVAYKPELGKYWDNGRILKIKFLGGSEFVRNKVRQFAREWSDVANIQFVFVEKGEADIRIGFSERMGTWSAIGTDSRRIPQNQPSMNYGWFDERTPDWEFRATILHEFGHALGLLHEHQHPKEGIPWDKPRLYEYYRTTQGWTRDMVDQQVLAKLSIDKTQYTAYDPSSIMHYPIPNALTVGDFEIRMNRNLSAVDRAFVGRLYPKRNGEIAGGGTTGSTRPVVTTTPSRPTTSTNRPSTTPTRPSTRVSNPPVVTTPARTRYVNVAIRDALGQGQRYETVWLTLNGITRRFVLDANGGRRAHQIEFELPLNGEFEYEIYTKTIMVVRGDNGRSQEKVINGYGKGQLRAGRDGCFDLAMGRRLNDKWIEVKLSPCD
jgi:serralysin